MRWGYRRHCLAIAVSGVALMQSAAAQAAPSAPAASAGAATAWKDPSDLPTEALPNVAKSMLLDIAEAGGQLVVVGERGHIITSTDGRNWKQITDVPTRSTLTAVTAVGNELWTVGHDGVILHSSDAQHWQLQRRDPQKPVAAGEEGTRDPRQGAPLLDVLFVDANNGFAVGAYSLFLTTADGGKTWTPATITVDEAAAGNDEADKKAWTFSKDQLKLAEESDPHLNAIVRTGDGSLFIASERGTAFRSRDGGKKWQRIRLPYEGSMFGALGFAGQHVLVFGLRGHVYETRDLGEHWNEVATDSVLSIMGGRQLPDDGVVLVGANGLILLRRRGEEPLHSLTQASVGIVAAVHPIGSGQEFLIVGENGASVYTPK
jgi:photosystem II stability/assembly factor-like uncharacterized protein